MSDTPLPNDAPQALAPEPPKGALGIIFFIVVIDLMGFGIIIPLLTFYIKNWEAHAYRVVLLFSVYSICQFIGAPILGAISDRIGRKPVLAFSQIGSAIGYILLAVATQFQWESATTLLVLVYLSRIIDGFTGGNISTAKAYISDVTTPANRARGMGLLGIAFGIGFALGPALGGLLGAIHLSVPAYVAAAFSAAAAALCLRKLPETRTGKPTESEAWLHPRVFAPVFRNRVLVQLIFVSFCLMAAFVMMESTAALFVNKVFHWEKLGVGLYFGYIGIVIALVQGGVVRRLMKKIGDWPLAIAGPLLVAVGMGGYMLVGYGGLGFPFGLLLLTGAINSAGRSLQMPTVDSLISKFSDERDQGVVFGFHSGLGSLARVVGPVLAGYCYKFLNNTGQFLVAAIIAVSMGIWLMLLRRPAPGDPVRAQSTGIAVGEIM
jgi:DHA1 family tetracycline resistance protein-like MFS transporter